MAYREVPMVLVHELIRRWQRRQPLRAIAAATGVDRKTVRRYVAAARQRGVAVGGPAPAEGLLVQLQAEIRPGGPAVRGAMWRVCEAHRDAIQGWRSDGARGAALAELLLRASGQRVPERTLSRFVQTSLRAARPAGHLSGEALQVEPVDGGTGAPARPEIGPGPLGDGARQGCAPA